MKTVINPTTPPPTTETTLPTDNELELTNLESGKEFCIEVISNTSNTGIPSLPVSKLIFKTANNIPIAMIAAVSAGTKFG